MEKSLEERIKKILEQCTPEENKKLQAKVESRKSSDEPFIKEYKNILKKRREAIYRNENNYREGDSSLSEEHVAQAMLLVSAAISVRPETVSLSRESFLR